MGDFAHISNGQEHWECGARIPRHRHDLAYAALVLSGSYEECGSRGRFRVRAGDVLLHEAFDAHLNCFQSRGAQILNLVLADMPAGSGIGRVANPDAISRAAERDGADAGIQLRAQLREIQRISYDWPDELARDLLADPNCRLDDWARAHCLAAETVSRGFGKVFGVTPASFRLEARARRAFAMIKNSEAPLATIAAITGFSDQAHMSRAVLALTGAPPGLWRRSNPFKTGQVRAA